VEENKNTKKQVVVAWKVNEKKEMKMTARTKKGGGDFQFRRGEILERGITCHLER